MPLVRSAQPTTGRTNTAVTAVASKPAAEKPSSRPERRLPRSPSIKRQQSEGDESGEGRVLQRAGKIELCEAREYQARSARPSVQTFSTSGRPRIPVGMKIRTTIRIENAATSLYSAEK